MTDITTSTKTVFTSPYALAEYLSVPSESIYSIVNNHTSIPFHNKYIFTMLNAYNKGAKNTFYTKEVICKDYVHGMTKIYSSINKAALDTGLKKELITIKLDSNLKTFPTGMLAGYDFYYLYDLAPGTIPQWKPYTQEESVRSRVEFFFTAGRKTEHEIEVYDVPTGKVIVYESLRMATTATGDQYFAVFEYLMGNKRSERLLKIFGTKIYRLAGDIKCWNDCMGITQDNSFTTLASMGSAIRAYDKVI